MADASERVSSYGIPSELGQFLVRRGKRLAAARIFQQVRIEQIKRHWLGARMQREDGFVLHEERLLALVERYQSKLSESTTHNELMLQEAVMTKALYKLAAEAVSYGDFIRAKRGGGSDLANRFLDHGNYLAYGLAATATWVTGLPHGFSRFAWQNAARWVSFRRGGLDKRCIDFAPSLHRGDGGEEEQDFRQRCLNGFQRADALDLMIDTLQETALRLGAGAS